MTKTASPTPDATIPSCSPSPRATTHVHRRHAAPRTITAWRAAAAVCALLVASLGAGCGDEVVNATGSGGASTDAGGNMGGNTGGDGGTTSSMGGNGTGAGGAGSASQCLMDHNVPLAADYDQFSPTMGSHCMGTNHQDITGIEKLVFLGDSITQGTAPTPQSDFYRTVLADKLTAAFPGLEVDECAANGARMDDVAGQLNQCFEDIEPKRTLIVMTMGGNDVANWAKNKLSGSDVIAAADGVADDLQAAVDTITDATKFPAGSFFVFSNVYEYTDGTGDLNSCPAAFLGGFSGTYLEGALGIAHLSERMMEIAVTSQTDMILPGESFCGHGFANQTMNNCYVGPDAENWFDISCIHPTPTGHGVLADMFEAVVLE